MSYENAPATRLLATDCACCSRPLVDSVSVECGVGPICREKYGYADGNEEHRAEANRVVAWLAINRRVAPLADVSAAIGKLNAWGFTRLATKIAVVLATVEVSEAGGRFTVATPYDPAAVAAFRSIPGRQWDSVAKVNTFPVSSRGALWACIKRFYAGSIGVGPKGIFAI